MIAGADDERIREVFADGRAFIAGLQIRDTRNRTRAISREVWPEQWAWLDALLDPLAAYVIGLKPRQVGYTTLTQAYLFWMAYTSAHPWRALSMAHEDKAQKRMRQMVATFYKKLPRELQFGIDVNNLDETSFSHNEAGLDRGVAGGRGQGRSYTYNAFHGTEMAFWPGGTAQAGAADDESGDAASNAFSSITATLHDENKKIILESTGNGPQGPFFGLWNQACEPGSQWRRVFVPWTSVERYRDRLTDEQKRELERDLDDDEKTLVSKLGLSLEQISWRRTKMRTENWTQLRFRREYPATDQDPFLVTMAGWYDADRVNGSLTRMPAAGDTNDPYVRFLPYERHRRYYMGVDTAGGVRRDHAVIHVLRDDLAHAARWASNTADPVEQALWVDRIGLEYGTPLGLIEANKYGQIVINRVRGIRLWKTPEGRDFWSTGDRAGASKLEALTYAREAVNKGWSEARCGHTLRQLLRIVQKPNGKIEGAGRSHDDFAMAYALALYCARDGYRRYLETPASVTPDTMRVIERRFGGGHR